MAKKIIKVNFTDFWATFSVEDGQIPCILKKRYNLVISEEPDFLFYSCFGNDFKNYNNCVKIFYGGENISPNFNECDYSIGFDDIYFLDRHFRLSFAHTLNPQMQNKTVLTKNYAKRKFCNFIYSNLNGGDGAIIRQDFCKKLMKYKHVDCPGIVLNNMSNAIASRNSNNCWSSKLDFIKNYKFTIAFENSSSIGYTTEKLIQPLQSGSIPIYWGNPEVQREFNTKAFINCNDYKNFDEVIEKIIELDNNDDLYMEMLNQPPLVPNFKGDWQEKYEAFIYNIIEKGNKPYDKGLINCYKTTNDKITAEPHTPPNKNIVTAFKRLLDLRGILS